MISKTVPALRNAHAFLRAGVGSALLATVAACASGAPGRVDVGDASMTKNAMSSSALQGAVPAVCEETTAGKTADGDAVAVCSKLYATTPFIRPAADSVANGVHSIFGTVSFGFGADGSPYTFKDREGHEYDLRDAAGGELTESSPLIAANHIPSSRVHFLVYEAKGTIVENQILLSSLSPAILVEGKALDSRMKGAWEGTMSLREGEGVWSDTQTADVRVELDQLEPMTNVFGPEPGTRLEDGTRFKVKGKVANFDKGVSSSTGKCLPALSTLGERNPLFTATAPDIDLWRYPAMHTMSAQDFHIVMDYPPGLYSSAIAMAHGHNFQLSDYLSAETKPIEITFGIHGNPMKQIVISLTPVTGGGGGC